MIHTGLYFLRDLRKETSLFRLAFLAIHPLSRQHLIQSNHHITWHFCGVNKSSIGLLSFTRSRLALSHPLIRQNMVITSFANHQSFDVVSSRMFFPLSPSSGMLQLTWKVPDLRVDRMGSGHWGPWCPLRRRTWRILFWWAEKKRKPYQLIIGLSLTLSQSILDCVNAISGFLSRIVAMIERSCSKSSSDPLNILSYHLSPKPSHQLTQRLD